METQIQKPKSLGFFDRLQVLYPKFLGFIASISYIIYTIVRTILTTVTIPVILVLISVVELVRIHYGILLFEVDITLAWLAAGSLILFNLVLDFTIHHIEYNDVEWEEEPEKEASIKLYAKRIWYFLGVNPSKEEDWRELIKSPAHRFKKMQSLLTFTILVLAIGGSMQGVFTQISTKIIDGKEVILSWHEALVGLKDAPFMDVIEVISGAIFSYALVMGVQVLTRYIAIQATEAESNMQQRSSEITLGFKDSNVISIEDAKNRFRRIRDVEGFVDGDKVRLSPYQFFDSTKRVWSRPYKSLNSLWSEIDSIIEKRNKRIS